MRVLPSSLVKTWRDEAKLQESRLSTYPDGSDYKKLLEKEVEVLRECARRLAAAFGME
jgi:hypothetical protein